MNTQTRTSLFAALWQDYQQHCPSATAIHRLLEPAQIVNDHVAFRTVNLPQVGLARLAAHFEALGYHPKGEYQFEQKKLFARHYEHADPDLPKVFISELLLEQCSEALQHSIKQLIAQLAEDASEQADFLYSGAPWQLDYQTYQQLLAESEYAAWFAAFGFRANHFTIDVNKLGTVASLAELNQILKTAGVCLNQAGGEIKGSKQELLEQSSTLADHIEVHFSDGSQLIPSCYYEFAQRYPLANGQLYQGFVAASADKIFESTDQR